MSLALCRVPDGPKKRAAPLALPIRILTNVGARVALQRCSILRVGSTDSNINYRATIKSCHSALNISSGFLDEATILISSGFLPEAIRSLGTGEL